SAHRPRSATPGRRWKVVVISGPVRDRRGAGARRPDDTPGGRCPRPDRFLAGYDQQGMGRLVEHVRAVRRAHHDVLDPDPEPAREVDARLDAERVPGLEALMVARDQVRLLVGLEPDPVPEPVDERVAEAAVTDHRPR